MQDTTSSPVNMGPGSSEVYFPSQGNGNRSRPKRPKTVRVKTLIILILLSFILTSLMFGFLYYRGKRLIENNDSGSITSPPRTLYSIYEGEKRLSRPITMAVAPNGTIHISNNNLHTVEVISETGKGLISYGGIGSERGQMMYPYGVGFLPNGNVLVAETGNYRIQEFSPKGEYLQAFVSKSNKLGLEKPGPITVDRKGRVYIGDISGNQVLILDINRKLLRKIKGIQYPHGLAVDEERNRLYIGDSGQACIKVFDLSKNDQKPINVIRTWKPNTRFAMVRGLAVDKHGRLYVVDSLNCAVRVFDKNGEYLFSFGQQGFKDGEFLYPNGIFVDRTGKLYIADWGNDRIQVWGY